MTVCLAIYKCPRHGYLAIAVQHNRHSGGTRLTSSKCCGQWTEQMAWMVEAEDVCAEIMKAASSQPEAQP